MRIFKITIVPDSKNLHRHSFKSKNIFYSVSMGNNLLTSRSSIRTRKGLAFYSFTFDFENYKSRWIINW